MSVVAPAELLAPPDFAARARRLFNAAGGDADFALTLGHLTALRFFAGGHEGLGVLRAGGETTILAAALQTHGARTTGMRVVEYGHRHEAGRLAEALRAEIPSGARVGYWGEHLSVRQAAFLTEALPGHTLVDISDAFMHIATYKDADELARLRRACDIASQVARETPDLLHEGMTELELAGELIRRLLAAGSDGTAFGVMAAFGENSAFPHSTPGARQLHPGDFVMVDFGAVVDGCGSDITRTLVFGRATDEQRRMYDLVARAQAEAFALCEQRTAKDTITDRCSAIFAAGGQGPMWHGVGHGLGSLGRCPFLLEPGCVSTVEPGLYVPGRGGVRIEDDILAAAAAVEVLTDAPRALTVV